MLQHDDAVAWGGVMQQPSHPGASDKTRSPQCSRQGKMGSDTDNAPSNQKPLGDQRPRPSSIKWRRLITNSLLMVMVLLINLPSPLCLAAEDDMGTSNATDVDDGKDPVAEPVADDTKETASEDGGMVETEVPPMPPAPVAPTQDGDEHMCNTPEEHKCREDCFAENDCGTDEDCKHDCRYDCCQYEPEIIACPEIASPEEQREAEKDTLIILYNKTKGDEWLRAGGWLEPGVDHCEWEGVTCNCQRLVSELKFRANNLVGLLPELSTLKHLEFLDMSSNSLNTKLPIGGNYPSLRHVNLAKNNIAGTLSDDVQKLEFLDLSSNKIQGFFEPPVGGNLTYLDLGENKFEFVNVSQLISLRYLDLSKNPTMNEALDDVGLYNLVDLEQLNLENSYKLTGDLRVGHLQQLKLLNLNNVRLAGPIEDTGITNVTNLTHLNLANGNSFSGVFDFCNMTNLVFLSVGGNDLSGDLSRCQNFTSLQTLSLVGNSFTGQVFVTGGASALKYIDLSGNEFSGALPNFEGLSGLVTIQLSDNKFTGTMANLTMPSLRYLNLSHNELSGSIPSLSKVPLLETLDLSEQAMSAYFPSTGQRVTRGLNGQIPLDIGELRFLQKLDLSGNLLTGSIPDSLAMLAYLQYLDFEDNLIGSQIPSSINILQQLGDVRFANNSLVGDIPDLGGSKENIRTVTLSGNADLKGPAPFNLCDLDRLDLRTDEKYCPSDRSALAAFYESTLGSEWLNNDGWFGDNHHCDWFGVTCNEDRSKVLNLTLISNGLAGQLPEEFFKIESLQVLDLNDNDIRGEVPTLIGKFEDLTYLRLSYNRLTRLPDEIKNLKKLALVHLHSNRLTGDGDIISIVKPPPDDFDLPAYKFISDCGSPQDASEPFVCLTCDMCCNSLEECQEPLRQTYDVYTATSILIGCVVLFLCVIWVAYRFLVLRNILSAPNFFALKAAGEDSVYSFLLADRKGGWVVAIGTGAIQVAIFVLFLQASSFDNDDGDYVYSFRCPLNSNECGDERAISTYGWTMWAFLVTASLLDDAVNGMKLLFISSARGSVPCFVSGLVIFGVTILAAYTSFFYNRAIAMTNTELIVNAVILLFINDVDEQVFSITRIVNGAWLQKVTEESEEYSVALLNKHIGESRMQSTLDSEKEVRAELVKSAASLSPAERRQFWRDSASAKGNSVVDQANSSGGGGYPQEHLMRKLEILQDQVNELRSQMLSAENTEAPAVAAAERWEEAAPPGNETVEGDNQLFEGGNDQKAADGSGSGYGCAVS